MSEGIAPTIGRPTPGAMLREARQAQGVHIAALAAAMKVSQRKLESLEADRLDELPDATFTRALAQSVCRSLKIDPAPVLALLPQHAVGHRLEHVSEGINEPFRDRPGRREPPDWAVLRSPVAWVVYLLLLASAIVYFMPQRWMAQWQLDRSVAAGTAASAASSAQGGTPSGTAGTVVETLAPPVVIPTTPSTIPSSVEPAAPSTTGAAMPASAAAAAPSAASAAALLVRATAAASWIEVQDARSRLLLARTVAKGESVALDGIAPFRVKVGNAAATELVFQGQPVNLAASTRDNVARLELK